MRFRELDLGGTVVHKLTSPSISYLLLVAGLLLIVFELYMASIGLAGLAGALALVGAAVGLSHLPVAGWALALISLGVFGFTATSRPAGGRGGRRPEPRRCGRFAGPLGGSAPEPALVGDGGVLRGSWCSCAWHDRALRSRFSRRSSSGRSGGSGGRGDGYLGPEGWSRRRGALALGPRATARRLGEASGCRFEA